MKKSLVILICLILFSLSCVSAFSFSDFFEKIKFTITGRVIECDSNNIVGGPLLGSQIGNHFPPDFGESGMTFTLNAIDNDSGIPLYSSETRAGIVVYAWSTLQNKWDWLVDDTGNVYFEFISGDASPGGIGNYQFFQVSKFYNGEDTSNLDSSKGYYFRIYDSSYSTTFIGQDGQQFSSEQEARDSPIQFSGESICTTSQPQPTCTDSDGGMDYFNKGVCRDSEGSNVFDICISGKILKEYYCEDLCITTQFSCPKGSICQNSKCIYYSCTDSDNGNNIFEKGEIHLIEGQFNYTYEDHCSNDGNYVVEYMCEEHGVVPFYELPFQKCPNGCENGACIKEGCIPNCTGRECGDDGCGGNCGICESGNCVDGACVEEEILIAQNKKSISKYSDKEVFLISDKNWRDVLSLVPLTTWTQQDGDDSECQRGYGTPKDVCVYPTLIYHEETSGFDADSIIYFMQQYDTNKVTIIDNTPLELDNLLIAEPELGVGLNEDQIQRIFLENYLDYWNSYKDVVYVEDNYELALLASTYASLINVPLIIEGTDLDEDSNFENRNIICIGDVDRNCDESYDLESLQQKYVDETNTDKIILINPNDLDIKIEEEFHPEKSSNSINDIYGKISLAAPILAGAKKEVILFNKIPNSPANSDCNEVQEITQNVQLTDEFLETSVESLFIEKPNYLTIISHIRAIPDSVYENCDFGGDQFRTAKDVEYGHIGSSQLSVGRIYGIDISDVSAYNSRVLFYQEIIDNLYNVNEYTGLSIGHSFISFSALSRKIKRATANSGYNSTCFSVKSTQQNPSIYEDKVVWDDDRDGDKDIFMYDLILQEEVQITDNSYEQSYPDIYGNKIVWEDNRNGNPDIFMYDIDTEVETRITTNSFPDVRPRIYDNFVVWEYCTKLEEGYEYCDESEIYLYDINEGTKRQITITAGIHGRNKYPQIYDNRIVYEKLIDYSKNIYMYDTDTEVETRITEDFIQAGNPKIYRDKIVWEDNRNGNSDIYMCDLEGNTGDITSWCNTFASDGGGLVQITTDGSHQDDSMIYKDIIVWEDWREGGAKIYMYDLLNQQEKKVGFGVDTQYVPTIYDDKILWHGHKYESLGVFNFDIHMHDLSTSDTLVLSSSPETLCTINTHPDVGDYDKQQFILFADHGYTQGWYRTLYTNEIPWLDPSYSFAVACLTNNVWVGGKNTFGINLIRKGIISYQAPIGLGDAAELECLEQAIKKLTENKGISLGELHNYIINTGCGFKKFKNDYILLGDPTLIPKFKKVKWE